MPRLIRVVGALFFGKGIQGVHGLPHFVGLHPRRQLGLIQPLALGEEFQPALLLGFDPFGDKLVQFEQPDAAVLQQYPAVLVAQAVAVGVCGIVVQQILGQQPDGIGGTQRSVVLPAAQLRAVKVGPGVQNTRRQLGIAQELNLDLVDLPGIVARLDVDDAQLVVEEFSLVVGVENADLADRTRQCRAKDRVEKVDEQPPVAVRTEQRFENTIDLRVNRVAHTYSLADSTPLLAARQRQCGKRANPTATAAPAARNDRPGVSRHRPSGPGAFRSIPPGNDATASHTCAARCARD